jgi:NADH-quinone oxidoreductase subunit G
LPVCSSTRLGELGRATQGQEPGPYMTVRVRIDDREIAVESGTSILRAASQAGVYVPHLCYNENLSIRGSCRICLVEVEGNPKLQPACSTAVCDRMVVRTDSHSVREARKGVLELLLINHPLDCPVCDKGGECKLQDYVFWYGGGRGRFAFDKRTFAREDIGPFVTRDMNRCIHCTRCVRFTSEITQTEDLGAFDRGENTSIGTYLGRELQNPFSGNVTELCPVGALTDRVFRFKARVWELEEVPSACPLCPVGCLIHMQLDKGRIARVRSREGGVSPWICDLGRFGFAAVRPREKQPVIKENGRVMSVPWDVALRTVGERCRVVAKQSGPQSIGVFCSTSATNEEIFAIQHVFRNLLGSHNIDFRFRAATPVSPEEAQTLSDALRNQGRTEELSDCKSILLFCSDPCEETPIAGLEIVRAVGSGCRVASIGPRKTRPEIHSLAWLAATPEDSALVLASLAKGIAERALAALPGEPYLETAVEGLQGLSLETSSQLTGIELDSLRSLVDEILSPHRLGLVVGREVFNSRFLYLTLSSMLRIWAARTTLGVGETLLLSLLGEKNVRGALELGAFPVRLGGGGHLLGDERPLSDGETPTIGKSFGEMIEAARSGGLRALFVFGGNPLSEYEDRRAAQEALASLDFLVVQNETMNETATMAHVYLPLQDIFEREGSFLTLDGDLKALHPQISFAGSRSLVFDVLESLSRAMDSSFRFTDADSALREMRRVYGWDFDQDLKGLAAGQGVKLYNAPKEPSHAWLAPREFEKKMVTDLDTRIRERHGNEADFGRQDYPYTLITGTAGISSWVWAREVSKHRSIPDSAFAEISDADAEELGVNQGSLIEIESLAGSIRVRAKPTKHLMKGVVFVPYDFGDARANVLTRTGEFTTKVRLKKSSA